MGVAKDWVEENFPKAMGGMKASLILAYGAGMDAGYADAMREIEAMKAAVRRLIESTEQQP